MGKNRIHSAVGVVSVMALALIAGCGTKQPDASMQAPPPSAPAANMPAAGPAISTKLKFEQLALESPVKAIEKKGLPFLQFAFADRDGNVYKCELPKAMSEGEYPIDEWIRTFNIYKLPQVIAKRKTKAGPKDVGGFPFISPKPKPVPTEPSQAQQPKMPTLPSMPMPAAGPQGGPMGGRPGGMAPMGPGPAGPMPGGPGGMPPPPR